jgi:hypothetical protein
VNPRQFNFEPRKKLKGLKEWPVKSEISSFKKCDAGTPFIYSCLYPPKKLYIITLEKAAVVNSKILYLTEFYFSFFVSLF